LFLDRIKENCDFCSELLLKTKIEDSISSCLAVLQEIPVKLETSEFCENLRSFHGKIQLSMSGRKERHNAYCT